MTTIVLTRHGETAWNIVPVRYRGRADVPLTDNGRAQARATADYIDSAWKPVAIYASPLGRCIETGRLIGESAGMTPRPCPGLCDIDYGDWQGLTETEVRARWPEELDLWQRVPHLARIPGGETLQVMFARVATALRDLLRAHPHDTIVIIGHDSVNRLVLLDALGLPLSSYPRLAQGNCAVNELRFVGDAFFVGSINETFHLRAPAQMLRPRTAAHDR